MNLLARLRSSLRALLLGVRMRSEVAEEMEFHLAARVEELTRTGMSRADSIRHARAELGPVMRQQERYREAAGLRAFDEISGDLRFGLRTVWKQPVFTAVMVLSLALGIGATTAMFSLIYAVLLHPFPYADSDRIMNPVIVNEDNPQELRWFAMTKPQFEQFGRASSIESLLGFRNVNMEISGNELPEEVAAVYLTENADTFFRVPAYLGRGIQTTDAETHQRIVVLNYKFWRRHYNGDPTVVGRTLQLNHEDYTIVGVMPRRFAFNDTFGTSDIYLPRNLLHDSVRPLVQWPYTPWIKIKAGMSRATADAELGAIVHQFAKEFPARFPKKFHLQLQPIVVPYEQNTGAMLALLFAGVVLLLLIGCANCSILTLARGASRQHELAVRSAVGASRWRIVRQLLVESAVISFVGAALGVAASYWLAKLPLLLAPNAFPAESVIQVNAPILAFSVVLTLLTSILLGLSPALRLSRPDVSQMMQSSHRRIGGVRSSHAFHALIAGQIALTLLLMATASIAMGAFLHLMNAPLGYEPKNVMEVGVAMHFQDQKSWEGIKTREARAAYIERVRQSMAQVPGVLSIAVSMDSTPPYSGVERGFEIAGIPATEDQQARVHLVDPRYFATLQIPLLAGRYWSDAENTRGDGVAVINEAMAHRYWPNGDAIGKQLSIPSLKSDAPLVSASSYSSGTREIIGVVGDARNDGLERPALPAIYVPYTTLMAPYTQYLIKAQSEPLALIPAIRAAVQSVSADQPISNGYSDLKEAIERDAQWSRQRLFSVLFGVFSAIALMLALVGLFSVVSYSVAQRTNEFGVRMALGAQRSHVLWIALRTTAWSAGSGILLGLLVNQLLHGILVRWMRVHASNAAGLATVTLLLSLCALAACILPALRAASIRPVEALRYE
ncbi:ADOP family duplicated permease [Acidicapsa dinghuensis]|uniref:ADOP family duplicated permease n=1 Tax=Acidicapsa dinghuensis TaxID=2218256 RepID=A0ABW1EI32_9BACT|nr:ABC transporter permease [Acidicapsa dinghuensis]